MRDQFGVMIWGEVNCVRSGEIVLYVGWYRGGCSTRELVYLI